MIIFDLVSRQEDDMECKKGVKKMLTNIKSPHRFKRILVIDFGLISPILYDIYSHIIIIRTRKYFEQKNRTCQQMQTWQLQEK